MPANPFFPEPGLPGTPPPSVGANPKTSPVTRRDFLRQATLMGTALAAPLIVPASVLGRGGAVAPSERIVLGGIGIG